MSIIAKAAILVATLCTSASILTGGIGFANELKKECRAVEKVANITLSSKLVLSIASDATNKTCDFFVSLPPPNSIRKSVETWFKTGASLPPKDLSQVVADIAIAAIPPDEGDLIKAVELRIGTNSDLVSFCVKKLFEKECFAATSKDGQLRCDVSASLEQATFVVAVSDAFLSTVVLPRPA